MRLLLLADAVLQQQHVTCINTCEPRSKTAKGLYAARCARDDVILSIIKRIICARSLALPCTMCIEPHRQFGYASYARVYDRAKIRNVRHGVIRWKRNRARRETNFMERLRTDASENTVAVF